MLTAYCLLCMQSYLTGALGFKYFRLITLYNVKDLKIYVLRFVTMYLYN